MDYVNLGRTGLRVVPSAQVALSEEEVAALEQAYVAHAIAGHS